MTRLRRYITHLRVAVFAVGALIRSLFEHDPGDTHRYR